MPLGGVIGKIQSLSPNANNKYKTKMKQRYNLTDEQYDAEKKKAQTHSANWTIYRKDQIFDVFRPKTGAVVETRKSDVVHPKMSRAVKAVTSKGQMLDVEFGSLREHFMNMAPSKDFVRVKAHEDHTKALAGVEQKRQQRFEGRWKEAENKINAYNKSKSVYEDVAVVRPVKVNTPTLEAKEPEEAGAPSEKFLTNTTDDKHREFNYAWYKQSVSRFQISQHKKIFWVGKEEDDDQDDDPEGKYTVTAEKFIECMMSTGKLKESGIVEPMSAKNVMTDPLGIVHSKYKRTIGKEAIYLNTLKGSIDFTKRQATNPEKTSNTISVDEPTDVYNQITFDATITTHVFKGNRMKRQTDGKKDMEIYEEVRRDYTREAGEETSGI